MFRYANVSGIIYILHADSNKPMKLWEKKIRDGRIKRIADIELKRLALEITGCRILCSYIGCPNDVKKQLGIKFPYLNLTLKSIPHKPFAFDVSVIDDKSVRRRFRASTVQAFLDPQAFYCKIPLSLEEGWNQITIPLHHFTKEIYGTKYVETSRIQIYPNCLLKRIYFSDKDYKDEDLPKDIRLLDYKEQPEIDLMNRLLEKEDLINLRITPIDGNKERGTVKSNSKKNVRKPEKMEKVPKSVSFGNPRRNLAPIVIIDNDTIDNAYVKRYQ